MIKLINKRIAILGGTGSYGHSLLDYLKDSGATFVIFSRDEKKQFDMYVDYSHENVRIEYIIGDIRDKQKLIYSLEGIDYVFNAAALKHVPTGENFPEEVIQTNIIGTKNVIEACEYCGVKTLIQLSTDKATFPISCYGMTKAIGEKMIVASKGKTIKICLRYGNVLGSRGSVVPLFLTQIERNQPLTITNPNMTRFILTLEEAVNLSLKCLSDGNNGDMFIMKPPACSLKTLVEALELHFNRELDKRIIGIRAGEKMHEVLLTSEELQRSKEEKEGNIIYARISKRDKADYYADYYFNGKDYIEPAPYSSQNAEQYNAQQVLDKLKQARLL